MRTFVLVMFWILFSDFIMALLLADESKKVTHALIALALMVWAGIVLWV